MADTTKPDEKPPGLDKLDPLFRDVVSVSNKDVQKKMDAEKRARALARTQARKKR